MEDHEANLKTFVCTRTYFIDALTLKEAKEEFQNVENNLDYLDREEWDETD